MISFFVPGIPAPKGSKRAFVVKGRPVMAEDSKKTKPWMAMVHGAAMAHAPAEPLEGPVYAGITFVLPRPKTVPKERKGWPCAKPDRDKVERCVMDALTGVLWVDDAQVCDGPIRKRYSGPGDPPGVHVEVWLLDCEHASGTHRDGRCRDCGEQRGGE